MNTPPTRKITDEETNAANRFMHLLHHPEEQDRDGEQTDQTRNRVMNGLTGSSIHVPIVTLTEKESAITVNLLKTVETTPKKKTRDIAPWMTTARGVHKK